MKAKIILGTFLILLVSITCKNDSKKNSGSLILDKASVRLNWIPSCSFVGEITGAKEYAKENNIDLSIKTGGIGLDPIKLVLSGEDDFGVAGADLVIAANDKGAELVIIGLVSYNSPGVFLSKKDKNINSINDFKGKRIGELPGGNMQYLYEVFLMKTNLNRKEDFTPVQIPFDLKNFIVSDECDIRPVFIYDEPAQLDIEGIEYNIFEPKSVGIDFKGLSYFCKKSTIKKNPKLVQKFINTMAQGWIKAIKNPDICIKNLKEFDKTISEKKELLGLKRGLSYFGGYDGKVLYSDSQSWLNMIKNMKSLGFIKNDVNLDELLEFKFVENFHQQNK